MKAQYFQHASLIVQHTHDVDVMTGGVSGLVKQEIKGLALGYNFAFKARIDVIFKA